MKMLVFAHSLSEDHFATFEDCCLDFVKDVNPNDVVGFNTAAARKKVE